VTSRIGGTFGEGDPSPKLLMLFHVQDPHGSVAKASLPRAGIIEDISVAWSLCFVLGEVCKVYLGCHGAK